jgi:hypothetical protein
MVLLEVVNEFGSVYASTRSNKKSLLVLRQDKLELYQLRLKKILGARFERQLKKQIVFLGNFETVDNTSPATTWTSTGSPQPSAQISLLHFNKCKIFPHSCKIN